jgi:hypothetical protein
MLPEVTGLTQTAQDASTGATTFTWDSVGEADNYTVSIDGVLAATVPQSATPTVTVTPTPGTYTLGVAPVALATLPTTLAFTVPPPPPTGLAGVAASSTVVNLTCAATSGASGYDWYRDGSKLATTTTPSYSDASALPSTTYGYQVDVTVGGETSALSASVPVTTPATGVPPPPTNLTLTLGGTQTAPTVILVWDTSAGALSYDIYRDGVLLKNVP